MPRPGRRSQHKHLVWKGRPQLTSGPWAAPGPVWRYGERPAPRAGAQCEPLGRPGRCTAAGGQRALSRLAVQAGPCTNPWEPPAPVVPAAVTRLTLERPHLSAGASLV